MAKEQQPPKKVLLLHGNRQTGQLLLGRMDKLRKLLQKNGVQLVAPDAPFPHPEDEQLRQWWSRDGDSCLGLPETLRGLQEIWDADAFVGIMGFSQGARLAHLTTICHEQQPETFFPGLKFVVMVAGYEAPLPKELKDLGILPTSTLHLQTPSLHVWGLSDKLITPEQSSAVQEHYVNPSTHIHDGGHHVPMKAASARTYAIFMQDVLQLVETSASEIAAASSTPSPPVALTLVPDEETAQTQADEVEALTAIFPDEFTLLSQASSDADGNSVYEHPIIYRIALPVSEDGVWPPLPMAVKIQYPYNYPQESLPTFKLIHDNNVMQFSTTQAAACVLAMEEACLAEEGMPCVLSCLYAARDYFESGAMATAITASSSESLDQETATDEEQSEPSASSSTLPKPATAERLEQCNLQGLEIALSVLQRARPSTVPDDSTLSQGKGGSWTYTIGLVGKPSAGKSTVSVMPGFVSYRQRTLSCLAPLLTVPLSRLLSFSFHSLVSFSMRQPPLLDNVMMLTTLSEVLPWRLIRSLRLTRTLVSASSQLPSAHAPKKDTKGI
jgi:predicted esterase